MWCRLVNKCMSTHLNANANVSLDSNANENANVIFQERIQIQFEMFWGRILMQKKNNVYKSMYTKILLIYLKYIVVQYYNH